MIALDVTMQMPPGYRATRVFRRGRFAPPVWCGETPDGSSMWWRETPEAVIATAWAHHEGREWRLVSERVREVPVDLWLRAYKIDPKRGRTMENVRR
jgi:hypothetical protein